MSEQPEALRLADALEISSNHGIRREAAAELRRLHAEVEEQCRLNGMGSEREARLMAENEALRADAERLDWCISVLFSRSKWLTTDVGCGCCGDGLEFDPDTTGRAAIDAAKERT